MATALRIDQHAVSEKIGAGSSNPVLVILFIPTKDKNGKDLSDADFWLNAGITVLSEEFGGATVMAPAEGAWCSPEGLVIREKVHLVHSYGNPNSDLSCFESIADFMHRLGRMTNQGEIGIVVDGVFHRITDYRVLKDD